VVAQLERPAADVIAYIPPDEARQLRRGRHPAERLALELGRRWSLETAPLLDRVGPAVRQTGLARPARLASVRGAFRARAEAWGTVLLVDDVATTAAAATALRAAGAARVEVVTFARTVR
jgi:predicted amidophosphoribosyltransferase